MAVYGDQMTFTRNAAADLSGKRYHFVRASAAKKCNQSSLATDSKLIGVLQNKPESGENATIADQGNSKIYAGAAISVDAYITTNSSGRAVTVTSGDMCGGRAIEAAGADGDLVTVRLFPPIRWSGAA